MTLSLRPSRFALLLAGALVSGASGALPATAAAQDAPDSRPGVAVLAFDNGGSYGADREDMEALTVGLQQMILSELAQNSELRVVERRALRTLLEEQDLGVSGRVDPATAARVGNLVGARYVVTGVFIDLFGDFRMDAWITDSETSELLGSRTVRGDRTELYDLLVQMAGSLTDLADLPELDVEVRSAREEREIPAEAVILYSRAQTYEDFGDSESAMEVYRRIITEFPEMTEAGEALRQLSGG